jgi:hypothetical protein
VKAQLHARRRKFQPPCRRQQHDLGRDEKFRRKHSSERESQHPPPIGARNVTILEKLKKSLELEKTVKVNSRELE